MKPKIKKITVGAILFFFLTNSNILAPESLTMTIAQGVKLSLQKRISKFCQAANSRAYSISLELDLNKEKLSKINPSEKLREIELLIIEGKNICDAFFNQENQEHLRELIEKIQQRDLGETPEQIRENSEKTMRDVLFLEERIFKRVNEILPIIQEFISNNYKSPSTVDQLARGLSRTSF